MSVSNFPGPCLRLWCSSGSLRISPLHPEFRVPLKPSSVAVFKDLAQLSRALSPRTCRTACGRFTPNKSGQRSPPTYYRGCWHVVSRGFFLGYRPCLLVPEKSSLQPEGRPP